MEIKTKFNIGDRVKYTGNYVCCGKITEIVYHHEMGICYRVEYDHRYLFSENELIYDEPILDNTEKNYLGNIVRPFRRNNNNIEIVKLACNYNQAYIAIYLDDDYIYLPDFKKNTMYINMEIGKHYSLKELGLDN